MTHPPTHYANANADLPIPPERLLRFAKAAAWKVCSSWGVLHLCDETASSVVLYVIERPERGTGPRRLRQEAIRFLRAWFGEDHDHRLGIYRLGEMPAQVATTTSISAEDRALCLRRLQQVWPTLTARQRQAVYQWATRPPVTRSARGVHESPAARRARHAETAAAKVALSRIVDPQAYEYEARRNRKKLSDGDRELDGRTHEEVPR